MTLRETFDFMDEDGSGEVREGESLSHRVPCV